MKTLQFIVDDQIIRKDPNCDDFSTLIPGSSGYVTAKFIFSSEWYGFAKVAAFYSPLGFEYPARVLYDGATCVIPFEALKKRSFKVQVLGQKGDIKIKTNKVAVSQNGGKK